MFPALTSVLDPVTEAFRRGGGVSQDFPLAYAFARARVVRSGRRYASVHVEAWQDNRARLFAQATGHFLMPQG